jgi:hypothetical protein
MSFKNILLIPGLPRCGTTTVANILNQSSDISLGKVKEPHYFIKNKNLFGYEGEGRRASFERMGFITKHEKYVNNYDDKLKYILDASTLYSAFPECLDQILNYKKTENIKKIRSIVLFRSSFDRVLSHYLFSKSRGEEFRTLDEAIEDEIENRNSGWILKGYLAGSRISPYCQRFIENFGVDDIIIFNLNNTDLLSDEFIFNISKFLDIEYFKTTNDIYSNESKQISNVYILKFRIFLRKLRQINPQIIDNKITRFIFNKFMSIIPSSDKDKKGFDLVKRKYEKLFKEIDEENIKTYSYIMNLKRNLSE